MTEIEAAAPLDGWCVSSSNRLPVASYHVAHLSDALPKIRRGTEAGSPRRGADETLEPNLRWWEKAAEEKEQRYGGSHNVLGQWQKQVLVPGQW